MLANLTTLDDLLLALTRAPKPVWVAKRPNSGIYYITGRPWPQVAPNVVHSAIERSLLVEVAAGLWQRPKDVPPPRRKRAISTSCV